MSGFVDRTGQCFGRLKVISRSENIGARVRWLCLCECGTETVVFASSLGRNTTSCGCFGRERRAQKQKNLKHGLSNSRAYEIWSGMKRRCQRKTNERYDDYGGRGISVCDRWDAFVNFIADMGQPPDGFELDRIDVNGNYEPSNCRWVSLVEQANNKRNNRMVVAGTREETVAQYARRTGLKYATAYYRKVITGSAKSRDHLHSINSTEQLQWD